MRVSEFQLGPKSKFCSLSYLMKLPKRDKCKLFFALLHHLEYKIFLRGDESDQKHTTVSGVKNADSFKNMALPDLLGKCDLQRKQRVGHMQVMF